MTNIDSQFLLYFCVCILTMASRSTSDSNFDLTLATQYTLDTDSDDPDYSIFDDVIKNTVADNTKRSNEVALSSYERWAKSLDKSIPNNISIPNNFCDLNPSRMNYVLGRYAIEAVDNTGKLYASTTLYDYIAGLNRELKK